MYLCSPFRESGDTALLQKQQKLNIMNKVQNVFNAEVYESPVVSVVDIHTEGVLCQSGQFEKWEEETLPW